MNTRQLFMDFGHRVARGREDFLVTESNREAIGWIDRWPAWPDYALVLTGPLAAGKTHLCHVFQEKSGGIIVTAPALAALDVRGIVSLVAAAAALAVDDAGRLAGDAAGETALFHLLNQVREQKKTLLLTLQADQGAPAFGWRLPDLSSRIRALPAARLLPPDDTLLASALIKMLADRQMKVPENVLSYLLARMPRSMAAAAGIVDALAREVSTSKQPVTIAMVRGMMEEDSAFS